MCSDLHVHYRLSYVMALTLSLIRRFCSRWLSTHFVKTWKIYIIEWINYDKKWKTLWQKEKLHVLCNFFFCHYVFKKPSAAGASESVYMRERFNGNWYERLLQRHVYFNPLPHIDTFWPICSRRLLKTLQLKEKLLICAQFFF